MFMDFQNQYELEKHNLIMKCYKENVPFFRRGIFRVHLSTFLFLVWILVWTESAIRYYSLDYVDFSLKNPRIYILPVILLIVGWKLFKPYRSITEKTVFGKITDVRFKREYVKGKRYGRRVVYQPVIMTHLTIQTGDGKEYITKCRLNERMQKILEKGITITHIAGENYPICHDKSRYNGELLCTRCGVLSADTYTLCMDCKKRLWTKEL